MNIEFSQVKSRLRSGPDWHSGYSEGVREQAARQAISTSHSAAQSRDRWQIRMEAALSKS
jgi:hypothetical protein